MVDYLIESRGGGMNVCDSDSNKTNSDVDNIGLVISSIDEERAENSLDEMMEYLFSDEEGEEHAYGY